MKKLSIFLWTLFAPLSVHAVKSLAELNPLKTSSLHIIIGRLIRALLGLSGAIALLMFVWGGFLWLTSRGEPAQVTKGKETLKWATIGLVVIFMAYMLVNAVIAALTQGTAIGRVDNILQIFPKNGKMISSLYL